MADPFFSVKSMQKEEEVFFLDNIHKYFFIIQKCKTNEKNQKYKEGNIDWLEQPEIL